MEHRCGRSVVGACGSALGRLTMRTSMTSDLPTPSAPMTMRCVRTRGERGKDAVDWRDMDGVASRFPGLRPARRPPTTPPSRLRSSLPRWRPPSDSDLSGDASHWTPRRMRWADALRVVRGDQRPTRTQSACAVVCRWRGDWRPGPSRKTRRDSSSGGGKSSGGVRKWAVNSSVSEEGCRVCCVLWGGGAARIGVKTSTRSCAAPPVLLTCAADANGIDGAGAPAGSGLAEAVRLTGGRGKLQFRSFQSASTSVRVSNVPLRALWGDRLRLPDALGDRLRCALRRAAAEVPGRRPSPSSWLCNDSKAMSMSAHASMARLLLSSTMAGQDRERERARR